MDRRQTATLHISEVMDRLTVTVRVKGVRAMRLRFWLGLQLLKLASLVLYGRVVIEVDGDDT